MDLIVAGKKILEIRNCNLKCVPEDGEFYILRVPTKGTGKNIHGQSCLEVAAKVVFKGNRFISDDAFDTYFEQHQVHSEDFATMKSKWKSKRGGCVAWELELKTAYDQPKYLPSGSQDCYLCTLLCLRRKTNYYSIKIMKRHNCVYLGTKVVTGIIKTLYM